MCCGHTRLRKVRFKGWPLAHLGRRIPISAPNLAHDLGQPRVFLVLQPRPLPPLVRRGRDGRATRRGGDAFHV